MFFLLRPFALFFAAGMSTALAAPLDLARNVTLPQISEFDSYLLDKVLGDTQDQARFAKRIMQESYIEPSSYEGTIALGSARIEYHAEHGKIDWKVNGSGINGQFDALSYARQVQGTIHPNNVIGIGVIILVIGGTCGYLNWVATNNCQRACGENGVQAMDFTCGASSSKIGCVCRPNIQPQPPSAPYPAGPWDTGPYLNGFSFETSACLAEHVASPEICYEDGIVRQGTDSYAKVLGQGWLKP